MTTPKVATPITDKNGKPTTVHKNVDEPAAVSSRVKNVGGVPNPVKPKREPLINTAGMDAPDEDDYVAPVPGSHPKYGGLNWGVNGTDAWGDWQVNHGYYGSINTEFDGSVTIDGSSVPLGDDMVRWTSDTPTGEEAAILWQYRDEINAALRDKGYSARSSVRIRADITDKTITLREYDHRSWDGLVINRD